MGAVSEPFLATCSTIQGLRSGTRYAKCMTHYAMAKISRSHQHVSHRLWIDGLSQSLAGSRQMIVKLHIAPKSCVVCSHHGDAKEVVRRMRRRGYALQAQLKTGFLGVDLGGGRRTAREVRTKRGLKQKKLHAKVARFARASKRYTATSKLERLGAQAAGMYGQAIHGTYGRRLQQCRRGLAAVSSSGGKGICSTTPLSARAPGQDPGVKLPHDAIALRLQQWFSCPRIRPSVYRAWPK
eukprot:9484794-Pyramimonas_sp.AAC.1